MLFDSSDLVYFEVLKPESIKYVYKLRPAKDFGSIFDLHFDSIRLVAVEPPNGCQKPSNSRIIQGAIALVERGGCSFVSKSKMVEQFGAVAVLIADNAADNVNTMLDMVQDGTGRDVHIPAGFILGSDGYYIRKALRESHETAAIISIPVNVTTSPHLYTKQPPWSYW
ncbi:predicted protein [Nematostella vectensis]|uniref:PA domain-containing protein n=1 Tax=Nematostella vectensis TaxID=45351 RepID=A7S8W3_NEMVE|nr:predicted protein [Nematostella vectensis]|eukprot:XP_001631889.1 predicted protein [Nematostella vectensis]